MLSASMHRILSNVGAIKTPTAILARLIGVSATTLSNAFRDIGYLGSEKERDLLTITNRLAQYRAALWPLPLPETPETLRSLLASPVAPADVARTIATIFTELEGTQWTINS